MARELEAVGALAINHVPITRDNPFSAETDRINPNRRMPFLDDNGIHMFESMAINLHLAKRYGASTDLAPRGWEEEADCLKWSFWAMTELDIKLWELCITGPARVDPYHPWYTHPVVRNPDIPNRRGKTGEERFFEMFSHPRSAINEARLVREFQRSIGAMEKHLADHLPRQYLAADRFTVADLNVASNLAWARHLGQQAFEPFPLVGAWLERCSYSRPLAPAFETPIYEGPWKMWHGDSPAASPRL
jgi:glutathione S-transferase